VTKPIRLGLIGCGGIVEKVHARVYLSLPDAVKVVALADVVLKNLEQAGDRFDVPKSQRYTDYRDMLAKAEINAVTIATPHVLHAEQAVEAAVAGVAVISEKPMATCLSEADAILDAVKRNRVPYTVVHNYLFTAAMKEGVAQLGQLGDPIFGRSQGMGLKPADFSAEHANPALAWRASKAKGGGCIIDTSYHEIYSVGALMGSPVRYVEARVKTLHLNIDVDDIAMLLCEHENGAISTVSGAWCAPAVDWGWCEVHTTNGSLRVRHRRDGPDSLMRFSRADGWKNLDIPGFGNRETKHTTGHIGFFAAVFEALANGSEMPITGEPARHNLAIIEGARRATHTRSAIDLKDL
jgi:predicted dehydrogenase